MCLFGGPEQNGRSCDTLPPLKKCDLLPEAGPRKVHEALVGVAANGL